MPLKSVFLIPIDTANRAALVSEEDRKEDRFNGHCYEPSLDALGGKIDGDESWQQALVREVGEEVGQLLLSKEAIHSLSSYLHSDVPFSTRTAVVDQRCQACFVFYRIPPDHLAEWRTLKERYWKRFVDPETGEPILDPTRKRSAQKLRWVLIDERLQSEPSSKDVAKLTKPKVCSIGTPTAARRRRSRVPDAAASRPLRSARSSI